MKIIKIFQKFAIIFFFVIGLETFKSEFLHLNNWRIYTNESNKYGSIAGLAIFLIVVEYFLKLKNATKNKKASNV